MHAIVVADQVRAHGSVPSAQVARLTVVPTVVDPIKMCAHTHGSER